MDITFEQVEYRYMQGTPFEKLALSNINVMIPSGSFTAIIGHTGSGKSTLIQHLNGLLKPTKGTVKIGPYRLEAGTRKMDLKALRKKVGLVFQYPEHQLFEETVEKDICFGPINFGISKETAQIRAKELLAHVGLEESVLSSSPFQLSGGQMRRVAISGVLAVRPSVLVLDEPTAGLDPEGRKSIMDLFYRHHQEYGTTTVLVTHHMEDAAKYADHIIVLHDGQVEMTGDRKVIFEQASRLLEIGLALPDPVRFLKRVQATCNLADVPMHFNLEETADFIADLVKNKGG
ncbi:energy-coupling factor ABC transporter ATP-binding protein [bacterium LRH843]|nr:energy-coupling factor ABC transporter ATP-binding protein [bacterium LRH843]